MLSLPEDWDYTLAGLSRINRESKDAIRSAVNELEKAGYVQRRQTTDASGKFSANEYVHSQMPGSAGVTIGRTVVGKTVVGKPDNGLPSTGKPLSENPTPIKY